MQKADLDTGNVQIELQLEKNTFGPAALTFPITVNWAQGTFGEGHYG